MFSEERANDRWFPSEMKSLDQNRWRVWVAKGHARDVRNRARLNAGVRYVVAAVLLIVAAGVGSRLALYDVGVRFTVAFGAFYVAVHAFRSASYAIAGAFGLVTLLYNPIAPVFDLAGEWQRVAALGTAILFMVSFHWGLRLPRVA